MKKKVCNILSAVFFTSVLYAIYMLIVYYKFKILFRKFITKFEKNL